MSTGTSYTDYLAVKESIINYSASYDVLVEQLRAAEKQYDEECDRVSSAYRDKYEENKKARDVASSMQQLAMRHAPMFSPIPASVPEKFDRAILSSLAATLYGNVTSRNAPVLYERADSMRLWLEEQEKQFSALEQAERELALRKKEDMAKTIVDNWKDYFR